MAFRFDWTPLSAVYQQAERAGRAEAQTRGLQMALQSRQLALGERQLALGERQAEMQERSLNQRAFESDRAYALQLATSARQFQQQRDQTEIALKRISLDEAKAGSTVMESYLKQRQKQEAIQRDVSLWDSLRPTMSPAEYTRGLIELYNGRRPPKLEGAAAALTQVATVDKALEFIGQTFSIAAPAGPDEGYSLVDYYKDEKGNWYHRETAFWGIDWVNPDTKVTDPRLVAQLESTNEALRNINTQLPNLRRSVLEQALPQLPPPGSARPPTPTPSDVDSQFDSLVKTASPEAQSMIQTLLARGVPKEAILQAYEE